MSTPDLRRALEFGLKDGGKPLDVLFLDACLMGMIEVAYEVKDCAKYLIAGESLLWAQLPYHLYLNKDNLKAGVQPANLARSIVDKYNSIPGSAQKSWAIAAIDLEKIDTLRDDVDQFANRLLAWIGDKDDKTEAIGAIAAVYYNCQQFDDNADFKVEGRESYVDLYDFVNRLGPKIPDAIREPPGRAILGIAEDPSNKIKDAFVSDDNGRVYRDADDRAKPAARKQQVLGDNPAGDKTIFAVLAQTDTSLNERELQVIHLDNAYGLSIYFPLGDIIDAADDVPVGHMLDAALNRFTATGDSQALVKLLHNMVSAIDDMSAKSIIKAQIQRYAARLRFAQAQDAASQKLPYPENKSAWVQLLDTLRIELANMSDADRDALLSQPVEVAPRGIDLVPAGQAAPAEPARVRFLKRAPSTRVFNSPRQRA
jgi:hypothetical protein